MNQSALEGFVKIVEMGGRRMPGGKPEQVVATFLTSPG